MVSTDFPNVFLRMARFISPNSADAGSSSFAAIVVFALIMTGSDVSAGRLDAGASTFASITVDVKGKNVPVIILRDLDRNDYNPRVNPWATDINEGNKQLFSGAWWLVIFPGAMLVLIALSINLFGDWLRDALNPRLR